MCLSEKAVKPTKEDETKTENKIIYKRSAR